MADEKKPNAADAGAQAGHEEGASGDQNPLLPDLQRWKSEARDARQALTEAKKEIDALRSAQEQAAEESKAKSAEDYDALKKKLQADHDHKVRGLEIAQAGAEKGVHPAFLRFADKPDVPVGDVVAAALEAQIEFATKSGEGSPSPEKIKGGASPAGSGKRTWKESEVQSMNRQEYAKNRDEIQAAIAEGRFLRGQ
jgi:hypothetical protein